MTAAIEAGCGDAVAADGPADALVWLASWEPQRGTADATGARWVQLPTAGIELDVLARGYELAGLH